MDDMEVDHAGIGVEIRGGNVALVGNGVHDCAGEGILILGVGKAWLSHNIVQRNKGAGIAAREGAKPGLIGNVVEKNSLELPPDDALKERNFLLDSPKAGPRARTMQTGGKK